MKKMKIRIENEVITIYENLSDSRTMQLNRIVMANEKPANNNRFSFFFFHDTLHLFPMSGLLLDVENVERK